MPAYFFPARSLRRANNINLKNSLQKQYLNPQSQSLSINRPTFSHRYKSTQMYPLKRQRQQFNYSKTIKIVQKNDENDYLRKRQIKNKKTLKIQGIPKQTSFTRKFDIISAQVRQVRTSHTRRLKYNNETAQTHRIKSKTLNISDKLRTSQRINHDTRPMTGWQINYDDFNESLI